VGAPDAKARAALCAYVATFVVAVSFGAPPTDDSTSPVPPAPGGAVPVQPVGGGGCVIGLNCGCIRNITCPSPHPRRPSIDGNQHAAPAPPNP
jgi:hypothetical protein